MLSVQFGWAGSPDQSISNASSFVLNENARSVLKRAFSGIWNRSAQSSVSSSGPEQENTSLFVK